MRTLQVRRLGLVEYEDGLAAQKALVQARADGLVPDTLLLLQHPRVITLGRGAKVENVLWPREQLAARGFQIFETDRGGDVTYHGPGQLVGYPLLDLKPDRRDVRKYVAAVEELMIRAARTWGVEAARVPGRPGIWTAQGKLGAIGVHLARWITSHGFAFNVSTQLSDFSAIVPCGLADAAVASLESILGAAPPMAEVEDRFATAAGEVWESELGFPDVELRTVSVVLHDGAGQVLLLQRTPERGGFWQILTGCIEAGESPLQTAAREIFEETGFAPRLDELDDLAYAHAFALDPARARLPSGAPLFVQETAWALRVEPGRVPTLQPDEHVAWRWVPRDEALALLPFEGLRAAVRRATAEV